MLMLYLIFDDWKFGYTFRKIDLSSNQPDRLVPGGIARETASSLPPPFFRWNARREKPLHFVTIGSKILAMPPREERDNLDVGGACFDVRTGRVIFVPRHGDQPNPIYFQIGNRLFTLGCSYFQFLDLLPLDGGPRRQQWSWRDLPMPPFHSMCAFSHVVLPEDQTILVGLGFFSPSSTYSFHIAEDGSSAWKCLGNWRLPFHGRGYFDRKLNAIIGLSMYGEEPGRICSCQLVSATSDHCPDVKYCKENLFTENPAETHVGATLVYMGHKSKFCLVESVAVNYLCQEGIFNFKLEGPFFRYMFRLTTFHLKFDDDGHLTTGRSRRVRYYYGPIYDASYFVCRFPVAFCM